MRPWDPWAPVSSCSKNKQNFKKTELDVDATDGSAVRHAVAGRRIPTSTNGPLRIPFVNSSLSVSFLVHKGRSYVPRPIPIGAVFAQRKMEAVLHSPPITDSFDSGMSKTTILCSQGAPVGILRINYESRSSAASSRAGCVGTRFSATLGTLHLSNDSLVACPSVFSSSLKREYLSSTFPATIPSAKIGGCILLSVRRFCYRSLSRPRMLSFLGVTRVMYIFRPPRARRRRQRRASGAPDAA